MKTLFSLLVALSVLSIAMPASAAPPPFPNQRRIVSYLTNGMPVYAIYQIVGYDAMGYPIYQWVTQPASPVYVRPYYGRSYGHSYGYRTYNYRPSYVRPYYGGRVGHVGGPMFHGGGHMSHGGGHVSHGGGGHASHGGGHHH